MSFGSIDQLLIRKEVSSADTKKKAPVISHTDCFYYLGGGLLLLLRRQ